MVGDGGNIDGNSSHHLPASAQDVRGLFGTFLAFYGIPPATDLDRLKNSAGVRIGGGAEREDGLGSLLSAGRVPEVVRLLPDAPPVAIVRLCK
jgi:hypothetical protein